ncbi:anthrone oxygenase family protein [Tunicatimonas pelagia]|uniref:anthrone oxygenase family protein n=1 Tax=Tunicatimonas pelagia TaxID=931531 RepID=UPI0026651A14|nr:DUF1772 domain-containing protein [Tunicatimonas pelagia]WKN43671.1 DUF1772 domain-containing protein [Tunicatimonas pelagia]
MEISFKSITLYTAVVLTGLSAGFFYAWAVSAIPGIRRVADLTYLETMQSINRAVLNPAFFLIFFGSLILLVISTVQQYQAGLVFWLMLVATTIYLIGTFGVTVFGNVPLNNMLDALTISELSPNQIIETRQQYEVQWNQLHTIRTWFSVLSFLVSLLAAFNFSKIL